MTNYARIIDNVAVDVSADPSNEFHPSIAAEFVEVPDTVQPGWVNNNGVWEAPATVDATPTPTEAHKVSPIEFKLLFTSGERIAIKSSTDPVVQDFYEITNDPRLTHVDLGLKSTQDAIAHLVHAGILTQARADAILTGTPA